MRNRITVAIAALLGTIGIINSLQAKPAKDKTEVLVVGTIHENHTTSTSYSYKDLARIIEKYKPDVICVEIRAKDYRTHLYLGEMTLAVNYAIGNGKASYPIDYWEETPNVRQERAKMMKDSSIIKKMAIEDSLRRTSPIIKQVVEKYGTMNKWISNDYRFFNGNDYNNQCREGYRISMELYGDSPMNLRYRSRNDSMMVRINKAIAENPGKKIIVLTGGEHKHYFDDRLKENSKINVISLDNILPLADKVTDSYMNAYIEKEALTPYFDLSHMDKSKTDNYTALLDELLGESTIIDPANVKQGRIELATTLFNFIKENSTATNSLAYSEAWLNFLQRNNTKALELFRALNEKMDNGENKDKFMQMVLPRALGLCYDIAGDRENALKYYLITQNILKDAKKKDAFIAMFIGKLIDKPFSWNI